MSCQSLETRLQNVTEPVFHSNRCVLSLPRPRNTKMHTQTPLRHSSTHALHYDKRLKNCYVLFTSHRNTASALVCPEMVGQLLPALSHGDKKCYYLEVEVIKRPLNQNAAQNNQWNQIAAELLLAFRHFPFGMTAFISKSNHVAPSCDPLFLLSSLWLSLFHLSCSIILSEGPRLPEDMAGEFHQLLRAMP